MDSMFNNGHNIIISNVNNINVDISNNGGLSSTDALKLMINKRKLEPTVIINDVENYHENENDHVKRICTINDHQQHEQKE
ncbi:unnamed protein product [Rotaria sp. Silwood2]|nr:unnamed protein product [Rotaria sp. Silwood2]CAF2966984.1 unnamed protein product [Rotaria sp. Silwood2]CAF3182833.1 unnamed protein product [Rotaria sp. Silwood2]CAF3352498.1 unnamed protein product [Rotaria sp. Silwood2]CAF4074909.1 unnamed protein product [Rotaria sp. Silwood2]